MRDILVAVACLLVIGLAYGKIPGGNRIVWQIRPWRGKFTDALAIAICVGLAGLLVAGIVQVA